MGRYLLAWFPMILIAVANGALREAALVAPLGDHAARQVSTLILIALFGVYIGYITRRWPIRSGGEALNVGALWLALTLVFEFALGRKLNGAQPDGPLAAKSPEEVRSAVDYGRRVAQPA